MSGVRLRDGVEVSFSNGKTASLDGGAGDVSVLSHAHADHYTDADRVVASELTAALVGVRRDTSPEVTTHPSVDLFPAGHIAGSRAALLEDPETGRSILYTGDYCTRSRFYLEGFEPRSTDVLITEATYGKPGYRFPSTEEVLEELYRWLDDTMDCVVVCFGYALGRAQKLQRVLMESCRNQVYVTEAIERLNRVIEDHLAVSFDSTLYSSDVDLRPGDALVLPMQTTRLNWIEDLVEEHDAVTAGFSGWAADQSFIYRRGLDRGFVLSDHSDYTELLQTVEAVDPEVVYTHHGFSEEFARSVERKLGVEARALKRNQSTLTEF